MIERLLAGEAALERGELDAAERLFRQVADADLRNAIALVGLARVALARGDRETALADAERALAIDPDEAAASRLVVELRRTAEPELAPGTAPELAPAPRRSGFRGWLDRLLRRR